MCPLKPLTWAQHGHGHVLPLLSERQWSVTSDPKRGREVATFAATFLVVRNGGSRHSPPARRLLGTARPARTCSPKNRYSTSSKTFWFQRLADTKTHLSTKGN
eukprot:scaffold13539_cov21-Phaeocystis_antarctica.AAC.1